MAQKNVKSSIAISRNRVRMWKLWHQEVNIFAEYRIVWIIVSQQKDFRFRSNFLWRNNKNSPANWGSFEKMLMYHEFDNDLRLITAAQRGIHWCIYIYIYYYYQCDFVCSTLHWGSTTIVFILIQNWWPSQIARRSDTDIRFCQIDPTNSEALEDMHHHNIPPATLKRWFINALLIYNRYTIVLAYEAPASMELVQHHLLLQLLPSITRKESSSIDVENAFWLMNEYNKHGRNFITLEQLFAFLHQITGNQIIRLRGKFWSIHLPKLRVIMTYT